MLLNTFCCEYPIKRLYSRVFRPIFGRFDIYDHVYLARAAGFSRGLFLFGYQLDSRAKDLHLCLARGGVLEGEVGDSGFKGTLPVARKLRGVGNWLYNSVDAFPSVSFGLFYNKYKIHLRDWYLTKLPI